MSDFEVKDSFWESWISPGRRKGKKESKKDKKCLKSKKNLNMNTDEQVQKKKKKKNSKYKEAMKGRKEKIKGKKKKKNRLPFEQDDSAVFTQGGNAQTKQTLNSLSSDKLHPDQLTQDSKKKAKRKKKVGFELPPAYMRVKRPKFVSSTQQSPKESLSLVTEAERDSESCSHATEHSQGPTHNNDSQCTSDDVNSQDLFITQKTFGAPPSQPSSDEAIKTSPAATQMEQHHEEPFKCPQDPEFYQNHRKTPEQKPKTLQVLETEEEEEDGLFRERKLCLQSRTQLNTNHTERKKGSRPLYTKPRVMNPYLDEPVVLSPSPEKKHSPFSNQQPPPCLQPSVLPKMSMTSTSTQTDNFFTTKLSSYLHFCQKRRETEHFEDLEPLDLSSAQRARKDLRTCFLMKSDNQRKRCLSCSSDIKDVEVQEKPSCQRPGSVSTRRKAETAASPLSESDNKSADMSTSSEDNEQPCRTGKLDLTHVRAVQMKLNESFFFKTKGEGLSPRPESPLMKLAQGSREVKSKKGH